MENLDALRIYNTICEMLDGIKWKYEKNDKDLIVHTVAVGEDLTMPINIVVSVERNLMYIKSAMPFKIPSGKTEDLSVAVNVANYSMLNGSFEYDIESGYLGFKLVLPFGGCLISLETIHYMLMLTCQMTDKFNDKFDALQKGAMTLTQFCSFANGDDLPKA